MILDTQKPLDVKYNIVDIISISIDEIRTIAKASNGTFLQDRKALPASEFISKYFSSYPRRETKPELNVIKKKTRKSRTKNIPEVFSAVTQQDGTVKLTANLLVGAELDPRWADGPFQGLKLMPAKAKGTRFEQLAQAIFENKGLLVQKSISSDHDRIVDGKKAEIKGSTITKGRDDWFSFLQIRPAQDYECLILETFWFDGTVKFHKIPKTNVLQLVEQNIFKPQHGGSDGDSGTSYFPYSPHYR